LQEVSIDFLCFLSLHPVASIREKYEIAISTVIQTGPRHTPGEREIFRTPQDQGSDSYPQAI
jgi:hypothetical protein